MLGLGRERGSKPPRKVRKKLKKLKREVKKGKVPIEDDATRILRQIKGSEERYPPRYR